MAMTRQPPPNVQLLEADLHGREYVTYLGRRYMYDKALTGEYGSEVLKYARSVQQMEEAKVLLFPGLSRPDPQTPKAA